MEIKSVGSASDNLLLLLQDLYKEEIVANSKFVASKTINFIDLNEFVKAKFGQKSERADSVRELKVFFESDNEDDYAELYININPAEKWLELKEKDEEYRPGVLRA